MADITEKTGNGELVTNRDQLVGVDNIEPLIKIIRGQQVMLDRDLATLYGVETKRLNEQVKRNIRLQDTFGRENVVSVVLHMDEHTPHKVFSDSTKPKSICCYKAYSLLALPNG